MAHDSPSHDRFRQAFEIFRSVFSAEKPEAVLERVTDAVAVLRPDSHCAICLVDRDAGGYRLTAVCGAGGGAEGLPSVLPFGVGLVDVVAESRRPLLVPDVGADPRAVAVDWCVARGFTVSYQVPIQFGEDVLGLLNAYFPAGSPPTGEEQEIITLLAAQAAAAIHNTRLFMTSEKRRRAAEALADVGRLLTETLDPDVVSQRIADSIRALLGAQTSALYRLEPESGDLVSVAVSGEVGPIFGRNVVFPSGTGAGGLALREHRAVVSPDVLNDPRITLTPDSRSRIAAAGYRAVLAVPLVVLDSVIGALGVGERKGRMFDAEEIELAQAFAAQAALALENARLHEQTERRRKQAEVLASLARDIGASLDLRAVLQRIVDSAREVAGADLASIALREPGSEAMVFAYLARADYRWRGQVRADPGKGVGGQVLLTGRPFRTDNYAEDPRISKDYLDVVRAEGIIAGLVVPIRVEDRIGGLLSVANRSPRPFTARDEAILERLADHAAIAIRNIQSFAHEQEARAAAEASEQRCRDLVQSLDAIVWEADAETSPRRFTFVSQRAETMLGYPSVRWVTEPGFWASAIHPDDRERTVAACREGTAGKRDFHLEYRMVAADGREVWLHEVVRVIRDTTGNVLQRRGVMIDITERKRAEQTTAALEQIGCALSSSLDVQEVAQRIVDSVCRLLSVGHAAVYQLEPESGDLVPVVFRGDVGLGFRGSWVVPRGTSTAGAAVQERRAVATSDVLADRQIALGPELRSRLEQAPFRALLSVPLIVKGTVIGVLTVGDRAGRVFDEEAIRLAQAFGDLAALALENARLFEESERRRRSTEALLEIARVLGSTLESKKILKVIAQQAARAVGATRCTMRFILEKSLVPVMCQFADGHRDTALWATFTTLSAADADEIPAYAEAMRTKHPVVIEAAEASDRIPRDWVEVYGVRSVLVVPLIHQDEVVGILNLDRTEGPYKWRRDQIDLAVTIANQAALTIESAEHYRRAEERAQRLTALAKLTELIASARGSREVCRAVAESAVTLLGAKLARVWVDDPQSRVLQIEHSSGLDPGVERTMSRVVTLPYGSGLAGRVFVSRTPEYLLDVQEDPRWLDQGLAREARLHAYAGIPLVTGARVVGVLGILYGTRRQFTLEDKELLNLLADHAAIAIRNAELLASEQTARDEAEGRAKQQAAVVQIGQQALAGTDLSTLMNDAVTLVARVLAVEYCKVLELLPNGEALQLRAGVGWKERLVGRATVPAGTESQAGYTLLSPEPVIVEDLRREGRFTGPPLLHDHGVVSGVSVIIQGHDRPYGVLGAHTTSRRAFTKDDVHFLQAVANTLGTAIERKRVEEALGKSEERFRRLAENAQDVVYRYRLIPTPGFEYVSPAATTVTGYTPEEHYADPDLGFKIVHPDDRPLLEALGQSPAALAQPVVLRWRRKNGARIWAELQAVSIHDAAGNVVAIEGIARDITERMRAAQLRQQLLNQVLTAQEEERARIARELHDETGQSLASLVVGLSALENARTLKAAKTQAGELRGLAARAISEVRRLAWGLRPSVLDDLGLVAALERYAAEFARSRGIRVDVRARGLDERLPSRAETALYRLVQEALTNVAKHAEAKAVAIAVERRRSSARLTVGDDGRGFDVEATLSHVGASEHFGLHGMRERAALLGGSVTIESAPRNGTTIIVEIPLPETHDGENSDPHRG